MSDSHLSVQIKDLHIDRNSASDFPKMVMNAFNITHLAET